MALTKAEMAEALFNQLGLNKREARELVDLFFEEVRHALSNGEQVKRRGNRRYYQRQDVIIIRQIRSLLYEQGFTIGGARNKLGGEEARVDVSQSQQIVKQMRMELEELLKILRR